MNLSLLGRAHCAPVPIQHLQLSTGLELLTEEAKVMLPEDCPEPAVTCQIPHVPFCLQQPNVGINV